MKCDLGRILFTQNRLLLSSAVILDLDEFVDMDLTVVRMKYWTRTESGPGPDDSLNEILD